VTASRYRAIRGGNTQIHPSRFGASALSSVNVDRDGRFSLPGLAKGEYALVVDSDAWMLERPLLFRPDEEPVGGIVASFGMDFEVRDLSSREPVAEFAVRVEFRDEPTLERIGRNGRLAFRFPDRARQANLLAAHPLTDTTTIHVEARGYVDASVKLHRLGKTIWLWPVGDENVELQILYDDGGEWDGKVELQFEDKRVRQSAKLERIGKGRFKGRLPEGDWTVTVTASPGDRFRAPWSEQVRLVTGLDWKPTLVRARGGDLTLEAASGSAGVYRIVSLEFHDDEANEWVSEHISFMGRETRVRDLPPGRYRLRRFVYGRVSAVTLGRGELIDADGNSKGVFFTEPDPRAAEEFEIAPGSQQTINIDER
jgi:hypothetical protein